MNYKEVEINQNDSSCKYKGITYQCSYAIKKDKEQIINEAITNHNIEFAREYDKDSLKPVKVRLFTDYNDCPQFGMVLYEIKNTANDYSRSACGNYYPIYEEWLQPHFFQGSICW